MSTRQTIKKPAVLVNQKIRVLKDFCVVDEDNEERIRKYLEKALADHSHEDPEVVLDHAAHPLIQERLKHYWEE